MSKDAIVSLLQDVQACIRDDAKGQAWEKPRQEKTVDDRFHLTNSTTRIGGTLIEPRSIQRPIVQPTDRHSSDTIGSNWTNNFELFLVRLSQVIGDNPVWPPERDPFRGRFASMVTATDGGKDVYRIPIVYPMSDRPAVGADAHGTTGEFKCKSVVWDLTADGVTNLVEEGKIAITFLEPRLQDFHPMFGDKFIMFRAIMADSERTKIAAVKRGTRLRIRAAISPNLTEGIDLFFGVGKMPRKIYPYISLQDATLLEDTPVNTEADKPNTPSQGMPSSARQP